MREDVAPKAQEAAAAVKHKVVDEWAPKVKEMAAGAYEKASESVKEMTSEAKEKLSDATGAAKEKLKSSMSSENVSEMKEKAKVRRVLFGVIFFLLMPSCLLLLRMI